MEAAQPLLRLHPSSNLTPRDTNSSWEPTGVIIMHEWRLVDKLSCPSHLKPHIGAHLVSIAADTSGQMFVTAAETLFKKHGELFRRSIV